MSINVLTLFGLVLAIGIVVDDAIVVIENVERIMAAEGLSPRLAADKAIRQVGSALVAIVLVLCAVFVPVAFIGGVTGELFKQFAMTIVIAVVLSGIVALTLTPALCALLLKESNEAHTTGFFGWFNRGFARATRGYTGAVDSVLGRPPAVARGVSRLHRACRVPVAQVPTAFIPTEDKGYMALSVQLPDAASLQRTVATVAKSREDPSRRAGGGEHRRARRARLSERRRQHDQRRHDLPQPQTVGPARAARRARLASRRESIASCSASRRHARSASICPRCRASARRPASRSTCRTATGRTSAISRSTCEEFRKAVNELPAAAAINTMFRASVPQVYVTVDRTAAKARGVNLADLFDTLQAFLSTLYINDFNLVRQNVPRAGRGADAVPPAAGDIGKLYVRGSNNTMIPSRR